MFFKLFFVAKDRMPPWNADSEERGMPLNIYTLMHGQDFLFESEALGKLRSRSFSLTVHASVREWLKGNEGEASESFVMHFMSAVCQPASAEPESDSRLSKADTQLLTHSDIQEFSRLFIEEHAYILEEIDNPQQEEEESNSEFIQRTITAYVDARTKKWKDIAEGFLGNTRGLLDGTLRGSASLRGNTVILEPPALPAIPPSPILDTNTMLEAQGETLKQMTHLITDMNELGLKVAQQSLAEGKRHQRQWWIMFAIGAMGLALNIGISYLSYVEVRVPDQKTTTPTTQLGFSAPLTRILCTLKRCKPRG